MNQLLQVLQNSINVSFRLDELFYFFNECDTDDQKNIYLNFSVDNINYLQCLNKIKSFKSNLSELKNIELNSIYSELISLCLAYFNEDDLRYLNFKLSFETALDESKHCVNFYLKFNTIPSCQYNNTSQTFLIVKASYTYLVEN